MAFTSSTMLTLGTRAPDFALPDVTHGRPVSLSDFDRQPALLVMFICKHCPYVVHVRDELARIGRDYAGRGLGIVAISSNDVDSYPDDSPANLAAMARSSGFNFPLCYDETQEVARAYSAACTPDFFLFDADRKLVYRGQIDESRPGKGIPKGKDLRSAIDDLLAGRPVDPNQQPSAGCNIKWKPGNAPK
jgi:peroxiredoxin